MSTFWIASVISVTVWLISISLLNILPQMITFSTYDLSWKECRKKACIIYENLRSSEHHLQNQVIRLPDIAGCNEMVSDRTEIVTTLNNSDNKLVADMTLPGAKDEQGRNEKIKTSTRRREMINQNKQSISFVTMTSKCSSKNPK